MVLAAIVNCCVTCTIPVMTLVMWQCGNVLLRNKRHPVNFFIDNFLRFHNDTFTLPNIQHVITHKMLARLNGIMIKAIIRRRVCCLWRIDYDVTYQTIHDSADELLWRHTYMSQVISHCDVTRRFYGRFHHNSVVEHTASAWRFGVAGFIPFFHGRMEFDHLCIDGYHGLCWNIPQYNGPTHSFCGVFHHSHSRQPRFWSIPIIWWWSYSRFQTSLTFSS